MAYRAHVLAHVLHTVPYRSRTHSVSPNVAAPAPARDPPLRPLAVRVVRAAGAGVQPAARDRRRSTHTSYGFSDVAGVTSSRTNGIECGHVGPLATRSSPRARFSRARFPGALFTVASSADARASTATCVTSARPTWRLRPGRLLTLLEISLTVTP